MTFCRKWPIFALLVFLTALSVRGSDRLHIDFTRDAKLLPYLFLEKHSSDWGATRVPVPNSVQIYQTQGLGVDSAFIVHAFNGSLDRHDPAAFPSM